jgi:hypothetical protein
MPRLARYPISGPSQPTILLPSLIILPPHFSTGDFIEGIDSSIRGLGVHDGSQCRTKQQHTSGTRLHEEIRLHL